MKEKLIPVISTVLQFSQNELESAKQAWEKENKSVIIKGTQVKKLKKNFSSSHLIFDVVDK